MASSSSQSPSPTPSHSPSPSAFSSQSWNHDVFLSFRGEDTRKTFVDHLYTALVQQGIYTYKDDETLPRGELIGPSLKKAIKESQIAIIVLSKNYADSSWCLDELAHIMKCKDTRGQIVLPVFYDVDPSEVRKQKRKYGEAFMKHELENKNKVESWRKALVDASNISGWEIKHIANGHESKGIKEIVDTISQRLQLVTTSNADENLIGIATRVQDLKSKLQIGSGGVRMIGIWGVGGGGKTTLASSIYDEISSKFDGCCFVENIREESSKYGLEKLQEKILSEMKVDRVRGGRCLMNNRFRHRKVLIVLDDVDHLDQLKALAGSHSWFGEGSRIIITTRDEHLLKALKVDVVHNISLLNDDEAMKLFCKHAPQGQRPIEDYQLLSEDVVSYAGGLPLALTVLGCFLCDKDIREWRSALARLKEIPDCDIVEKLKISFDGLTSVEKELFLDIACFHRGRYRSEGMVEMLDACGFHPGIGIKVLIQKALITIADGKFDMHDLVEEMAHYIVRGEHPKNPEKHSRVWEVEDVLKLYDMDATTELDAIEALEINYIRDPPSQEVDTVEAAKFDYNSNHRFQHISQIVANMKNLRWINWTGGPASPFPTNFPQRKLCCLLLWGAMQKQLWEGYKHLPNLKIIELYGLDNLIMTPDFDGLPNLERFKLTTSPYLEEIHPSLGRLEKLVFISIENCSRLKRFPPITRLKKLETLTLSRNPILFKLLENQQNHIGLRFSHKGLRNLNLSDSNLEDKDMNSAVWELPNLQKVDLGGNDFSRLNLSLLRLPRLKWLDVSWCDGLVELSELPLNISVVIADNCPSLETFGDISKCKWLWNVSLRRENKLGPFIGDILQRSMLEMRVSRMGIAIEDHFFNVTLQHQIPMEFVGRLFRGKTSTLHLPHDWYNDFSGFLICIVTDMRYPDVNIIIKHEVDEEDHKSNEAVEPEYDGTTTCVGYVPFGLLRHKALLTSSYNIISFSVEDTFWSSKSYVGAELVPRNIKGDEVLTTKATTICSEFYDQEREDGKSTFTIQDDSHSIKILWKPYYNSL